MKAQHTQRGREPLDIFAGLNPDEQQQLLALTVWLGEQAAALPRGERLPPETLYAAIAPLSPRVANRVTALSDYFDAERHAPFEQHSSLADYADRAGLDREALRAVKDGLDFCTVGTGLKDRMARHDADRSGSQNGSGSQNVDNTPSLADVLSYAIDERQPRTDYENAVNDYSRNAAEGLTLRETLETLHDVVDREQQQQQQQPGE